MKHCLKEKQSQGRSNILSHQFSKHLLSTYIPSTALDIEDKAMDKKQTMFWQLIGRAYTRTSYIRISNNDSKHFWSAMWQIFF